MGKPEDKKATKRDKEAVERELKELRGFVEGLKLEDLKDGSWFDKLLSHALGTYSQKVNAEYFREKYPHLPTESVVQARIELASKYAMIEGGLSSGAYTMAVATTIGTRGGASPITAVAGGTAFVVDMAYLSQLQVRLAYDISVLYRVPIDLDDPDDLWKLIRIAFSIKVGEGAGLLAVKGVPAVVRPLVKKFYSGGLLAAARTIPHVGEYLLQRNVIKFAIPVVGIPATVAMNYWTTRTTGRQAQDLLHTEAWLIEKAGRIVEDNSDLVELLWAMWMTMNADGTTTENQRTLLHHVTVGAKERGVSEDDLSELRNVIEVDEEETWTRISAVENLEPIYDAAVTVATVNGDPSDASLLVLERMATIGDIEFDAAAMKSHATKWKPRRGTGKKPNEQKPHKTNSPRES